MSFKLISVLTWSSVAVALGTRIVFSTGNVDTFDNLNGNSLPVLAISPIPDSPKNLSYTNGFGYVAAGAGSTGVYTGIAAASPPNVAIIVASELSINAMGNIKAPENKCFVLKSLRFGCTNTDVQGAVSVPLPCTVTFTIINDYGNPTNTQDIKFEPKGLSFSGTTVTAKMQYQDMNLPAAKNIKVVANILPKPGGNLDNFLSGLTNLDGIPLLGNSAAKLRELYGPIYEQGSIASAGLFDNIKYDLIDGINC
ncbi:hypothetical protein ACN47E_001750 [Coniothyrium glycines]